MITVSVNSNQIHRINQYSFELLDEYKSSEAALKHDEILEELRIQYI